MIQRLTPDIDYLAPALLQAVGASQLVVADGMVHWSGIIAARSDSRGVTVAAADMSGQLSFILQRLDACLEAAGASRERIVAMTLYTTAIDDLSLALATVYAPWIGEHRPAVTTIGVARLAVPEALLEVQGCALVR